MTELMERAIDALRHIPAERQDDIVPAVMQVAGLDQPAYELSAEERADILEAKTAIARRESWPVPILTRSSTKSMKMRS